MVAALGIEVASFCFFAKDIMESPTEAFPERLVPNLFWYLNLVGIKRKERPKNYHLLIRFPLSWEVNGVDWF